MGVLTADGSKTVSSLVINLLVPCLLFTKILISVRELESADFSILVVAGLVYILMALIMAFLIRLMVRPPQHFWNGILGMLIQ